MAGCCCFVVVVCCGRNIEWGCFSFFVSLCYFRYVEDFAVSAAEQLGISPNCGYREFELVHTIPAPTLRSLPWITNQCINANFSAEGLFSITHVDGSGRVQTVCQDENPRFYRLIERFNHYTGIPIILNTSFNVNGEPIVCSADDALTTFFNSGLDYLALGNYLVKKTANV